MEADIFYDAPTPPPKKTSKSIAIFSFSYLRFQAARRAAYGRHGRTQPQALEFPAARYTRRFPSRFTRRFCLKPCTFWGGCGLPWRVSKNQRQQKREMLRYFSDDGVSCPTLVLPSSKKVRPLYDPRLLGTSCAKEKRINPMDLKLL